LLHPRNMLNNRTALLIKVRARMKQRPPILRVCFRSGRTKICIGKIDSGDMRGRPGRNGQDTHLNWQEEERRNASTLTVYVTSMTSSQEIRKKQEKIEMILTAKKIEHENIDIASTTGAKDEMRAKMSDDKGLPPQFVRGDKYLGTADQFFEAIEDENLDGFLGA